MPDVTAKPAYLSKTLWVNLVMAILALFVPATKAVLEAHPEVVVLAFSIINMVLRVVTKTKLELS